MPKSKVDIRPTARPGLHENSTSPSDGRKSTHIQSRVNDKRSPALFKTKDELSNNEESDIDFSDELDCSTPRKYPRIYPEVPLLDLSDDYELSQNLSPLSRANFGSPDESFFSTKSQCHPRTGPHCVRKELPVTPEKGSPGKKLNPESVDRDTRQKFSRCEVVLLIFIFCIVFVLIYLVRVFPSIENIDQQTKPKSQKSIEEVHKDFKREMRRMIRDFSQPKNFWIQLMAQVDSIMVDSPTQPAVILAVVPEDARGTATCLLYEIARAIKYAFEDTRFVMHEVSDVQKNPHKLKLELDEALQGLHKAHAAVIHNIENIPGEAAMIFHAYCDNENAPYKQVLLLPIIEVQGYYEDLAYERLDSTVDDHLTEIWGTHLQMKDVSAIISRIANSPVLIQPERREKINELCPL